MWANPSSLGRALDLAFPDEPSHEEEDALEAVCHAEDSHHSALRLLATLLSRTMAAQVGVRREACIIGLAILATKWGGNASRLLERITPDQLREVDDAVLALGHACLREVVQRREAGEWPSQEIEDRIAAEIIVVVNALEVRATTPPEPSVEELVSTGPARALRFEGDEPLGRGADGEVWRGRDGIRALAVKLFPGSDTAMQRALEHARALARVDHPNMVKAHYVDEVRHPRTGEVVPCIAIELVDGETIGRRLDAAATRPLAMPEALMLGLALIEGVTGIHAQGADHGDLFRENVMITPTGFLKIIDPRPGGSLRRLSSAPRAVRLRGDIDDVVDMCEELLRTAGANENTLLAFDEAVGGRRRTLEDVKAAFLAASGAPGAAQPRPSPDGSVDLMARIATLEEDLRERRQEEDDELEHEERRFTLLQLQAEAWNLSQSTGSHVLNEERYGGQRTAEQRARLVDLKEAAEAVKRLSMNIRGWLGALDRSGEFEAAQVADATNELKRVRALFGYRQSTERRPT